MLSLFFSYRAMTPTKIKLYKTLNTIIAIIQIYQYLTKLDHIITPPVPHPSYATHSVHPHLLFCFSTAILYFMFSLFGFCSIRYSHIPIASFGLPKCSPFVLLHFQICILLLHICLNKILIHLSLLYIYNP